MQLPLDAVLREHQSQIKRLKRAVARAERIKKHPPGPQEFTCPHCGAVPKRKLAQANDYQCRYPTSYKNFPGYHKARIQKRGSYVTKIIFEGQTARRKLSALKPTGHNPATM